MSEHDALWRIAFAFERIAETLEQHTAEVKRQVDSFEKTSAATVSEIERRSKLNAEKIAPKPGEMGYPTDAEIVSACMAYRHDYFSLSGDDALCIRQQAKDWIRAWAHALRQQ